MKVTVQGIYYNLGKVVQNEGVPLYCFIYREQWKPANQHV